MRLSCYCSPWSEKGEGVTYFSCCELTWCPLCRHLCGYLLPPCLQSNASTAPIVMTVAAIIIHPATLLLGLFSSLSTCGIASYRANGAVVSPYIGGG